MFNKAKSINSYIRKYYCIVFKLECILVMAKLNFQHLVLSITLVLKNKQQQNI